MYIYIYTQLYIYCIYIYTYIFRDYIGIQPTKSPPPKIPKLTPQQEDNIYHLTTKKGWLYWASKSIMGGALWEGMGWISLIFIVVQQPTAREWLTRFHASFLTDDLILLYKVDIFWVKPWVTPKTCLHGDSGPLIICTFLYFVHAFHTLRLFYMKMWFIWFFWHGDVQPGPLWFIFIGVT